ncbi:CoA pyrophosphatase [uncultured Draconibacterium sp.]|uniref:NUDIX hydrolase n=1 Tax=uncultured Draconibacterium sp. TaxID=1573823 RepID=UPI00321744DA
MNDFLQTVKTLLKCELPGASSHAKMLPPGRVLKVKPTQENRIKKSSVLLLLFMEENTLKVCLIKRPAFMKHHAGQIALPGGRMEPGETCIETALRETFEEIGIKSESIDILGKLSDFYVEVSNFQVQPVVGWLSTKPKFNLNLQEVQKVIAFPIKEFKPPYQTIELKTLTGELEVPCVKYEGEIIWGATAMILSEFYDLTQHKIERIIAPDN